MFSTDIKDIYGAVASWLIRKPPEGLHLYYQRSISREYCNEIRLNRLESLKWYLRKIIDNYNFGLVIGSVYQHQMFPVIDADSESAMVSASMWLQENKADHAIMASSESGFWIIINKPGRRWKDIVHWVQAVPGQDLLYAQFCCNRHMCFIRALMKEEYFIPVLTQESKSDLLNEFCFEIIKHFSSPAIRWTHRRNSYINGTVDLSSPDDVDIGFNLDEVYS